MFPPLPVVRATINRHRVLSQPFVLLYLGSSTPRAIKTPATYVHSTSSIALTPLRRRIFPRRPRVYVGRQVPDYLVSRQEEWEREEARRKAEAPDPSCPPGMKLMPEEDRLQTLRQLQVKGRAAVFFFMGGWVGAVRWSLLSVSADWWRFSRGRARAILRWARVLLSFVW